MLSIFAADLLLASASAQEPPEAEPGPERESEPVTVGGLVQTQLRASDAGPDGESRLFLRRVRLNVDVRLGDLVSGRIQPEFATAAEGEAVEVNEAYVLLSFHPAFELLAGKGGRPFGIVDQTSAATLIPIERGARFEGVLALEQYGLLEQLAYAGRSVGLQALGRTDALPIPVGYAAGYFGGTLGEEGPAADIDQVAGQLWAEPLPTARLGVAYTSRTFYDDGGDRSQRGSGYAVFGQLGTYGEPGPKLLAQLAAGAFDPFADLDFVSAYAWAGWRFPVSAPPYLIGVEPLVRASWADLQGGRPGARDGVLLTAGANLYAEAGFRLMLNGDLFLDEDADEELVSGVKAQFQLAF